MLYLCLRLAPEVRGRDQGLRREEGAVFLSEGGMNDTVGNPRRAQMSQFELFEPIPLLLKLDKRSPIERFEATASQSTVPSPLLVLQHRPRRPESSYRSWMQ